MRPAANSRRRGRSAGFCIGWLFCAGMADCRWKFTAICLVDANGGVGFNNFLTDGGEVVATYKLANINRFKLEKVIHKFFESAKLEIEIIDRFGKPVKVREWFLVPLFVIDEMVEKIKDGTISDYYYDPTSAELKR